MSTSENTNIPIDSLADAFRISAEIRIALLEIENRRLREALAAERDYRDFYLNSYIKTLAGA